MGDLVTRVLLPMDGSDPFRDFTTRKVKMLTSVSPGARISEMDDSATRILPQMDGSDLIHPFTISDVECPTLILRTPELPNVEIPDTILLRDFRSAYEGLNLEQLSTDLTAVGYSEQDPTAQNLFSLCAPPAAPWT
jgi:hypothetical protein